nr:immunoglobulin heavy chain junction region [Mus musculus]
CARVGYYGSSYGWNFDVW